MTVIKKYTKKDGSAAYQFNAYLGVDPATGKPKRTTRRGFQTKKEAQLALSRLKLEIEEEGFKETKRYKFTELYELWFESAYRNTVKESTYTKTQELFNNHILKKFGALYLDKITIPYCQKTVKDWSDTLSKFPQLKNYTSKVLDYAVTLELIKSNPMRKIIMPRKKVDVNGEKLEKFFTKEELQEFFGCLAKEEGWSYKWPVIYRVLAFSGMRVGEVLALTWKDIDFEGQTVTVNKTLTRGQKNALIIQEPKTKSGVRTIAFDETTLSMLQTWRRTQAKDYLKLGFNTMQPDQCLFTNTRNEFLQPSNVLTRLHRLIKKHDLKRITVHGFRHTHCSLLFESGASLKEVQDRLGHSDIQTTMNIYAHVTEKAKEKTAENFARYVNF